MTRWYWKRWVWAVVVGTTAAAGLTPAGPGGTDAPPAPPKVGDVISLKFRDGPERQVKIIKTEKQPDGSYLSEVKDTKSGETFTLVDRPSDAPPATAGKAAPKSPEPAKDVAKPKVTPAAKDAMPADPAKDRKPLIPALTKSTPTPAEPEPEKPGLLKRLFGRKPAAPPSPTTPPAATTTAKPVSPSAPPAPVAPPMVRPTPAPITPPTVGGTNEPPRVMPAKPVVPPAPAPLPTIPGGLPPIPVVPNGVSAATPAVVPAGRVAAAPADVAVARDIQPFTDVLANEASPGLRLQAVRGLAGCRHATTDAVKGVLFRAAAEDGHPAVRSSCLRELCKLGYHDPAFLTHLTRATADTDPGVRAAAKDALAKLTPRD